MAGISNSCLTQICSMHPCMAPYFAGTYSMDTLPGSDLQQPCFLILNSQPSSVKVGHWLLITLPSPTKPAEYYDPLGKSPEYYHPDLLQFIHALPNSKYVINNARHQPAQSSNCGFYVLHLSDHRCKGRSYAECLKMFDENDPDKNEQMVIDYFFSHIYKAPLSCYLPK